MALDPARTYAVQVWAQGREDSRERYEASAPGEALDGYETYAIVFAPSGAQEPPRPAPPQDRLAGKYAKPPLNMR
ncbi:hypothetical protein DF268_06250 [Streptomyces sp. V2]|uniref:Uncharacterized protein n=1 Tax=Streptomyces niveiscabiei TaxID=164115 RepID=A0ABW9HH99_9ACTN|nr:MULTISPECIES: hypothetical protein [Streptomyces]PWG14475.1 hypothetical protein DF268_06250 [Streptomyces sp. V2]